MKKYGAQTKLVLLDFNKNNNLISNGGDQTQNIMAEINVIGKVKFVGQEQQVSPSFVKQELVVKTDEQYPQHILINFTQGNCNQLDTVKIGDHVNVSINLRGREWVNPQGEIRYFNDIQGWRLSFVQQAPVQQQPAPQQPTMPANQATANFNPAANFSEEEADDLPF